MANLQKCDFNEWTTDMKHPPTAIELLETLITLIDADQQAKFLVFDRVVCDECRFSTDLCRKCPFSLSLHEILPILNPVINTLKLEELVDASPKEST